MGCFKSFLLWGFYFLLGLQSFLLVTDVKWSVKKKKKAFWRTRFDIGGLHICKLGTPEERYSQVAECEASMPPGFHPHAGEEDDFYTALRCKDVAMCSHSQGIRQKSLELPPAG